MIFPQTPSPEKVSVALSVLFFSRMPIMDEAVSVRPKAAAAVGERSCTAMARFTVSVDEQTRMRAFPSRVMARVMMSLFMVFLFFQNIVKPLVSRLVALGKVRVAVDRTQREARLFDIAFHLTDGVHFLALFFIGAGVRSVGVFAEDRKIKAADAALFVVFVFPAAIHVVRFENIVVLSFFLEFMSKMKSPPGFRQSFALVSADRMSSLVRR